MKIRELIEYLSGFNLDKRVEIKLHYFCESPSIFEARDILDEQGNLKETIIHIGGGNRPGKPHLNKEEWEDKKQDILKKLLPISGYRFWRNGNNNGLYLYTGSGQDYCWTEYYDPRMWKELEAEGKIEFRENQYSTECMLKE